MSPLGPLSKPSTQAILAESWRRTLVVGHRGAADAAPENTLPAFEEGIASGASAVECDVHLSLDRKMVVIHDATLDRTTSLVGKVAETPWEAMRAAGVPSLADVARATKDRAVLVVEIKGGDEIEPMLVDHLRREGMVDQSIVFSFDGDRIAKVEALAPEFVTVWLVAEKIDPLHLEPTFERLRASEADGMGVDYRNCASELVVEAHRRGVPIFVWTVPPGAEVERLRGLGVNFIVTNHPRDVRAQLGL